MSCGDCSDNCSKKPPINKQPRFPLFLLKEEEERYFASISDAGRLIAWNHGKVELCCDTKYNVLQNNLSLRQITEGEKKQLMDIAKEFSAK